MGSGTARCFCSESKPCKRSRVQFDEAEYSGEKACLFDCLPDDIVLSILCYLSASADCPCKRMNRLGKNPLVLEKATLKSISIRVENWSPPAHRFLKRCVRAGNVEACYLLGMIECYCLGLRRDGCHTHTRKGLRYLLRASRRGHAAATYSLAVIFFNGTGMGKSQENLSTGFSLCQRATQLGYVDAMRELGHCLQDGYGVAKDVPRGRRLLVDANTRELAVSRSSRPVASAAALPGEGSSRSEYCYLHSDFGCDVPAPEVHPANRFMAEWFQTRQNLGESVRLCANANCSRPETRRFEFRVCSMCAVACYCSRACQAVHWKTVHSAACTAAIAARRVRIFNNALARFE
ncbi:hypothetical protein ZIOFF_071598 [Zingiber officinale]|uniref:MYND-type domain-containing protein n=2 Tax=Zingiber officinale TaxID=94328 RepID=A0A8J5C1S5_ZINOF|nr:hypothetical protein ZIOFF_071598 [Zingiber officinale]